MTRSTRFALALALLASAHFAAAQATGQGILHLDRAVLPERGAGPDPLLRLHLTVPPRALYEGNLALVGGERAYGLLRQGGHAEGRLVLPPGVHIVSVACDGQCASVRLRVWNEDGFAAEAPATETYQAGLRLEVARPTVYRFRVTMRKCADDPCEFGIAVFVMG